MKTTEAILGIQDFVSKTLTLIDVVVYDFVEKGFNVIVAQHLGIINSLLIFYIITIGYRALYSKTVISIEALTKHLLIILVIYAAATKWYMFNLFFYDLFTKEPEFINRIITTVISNGDAGKQSGFAILDGIFKNGIEQTAALASSGITGKIHALLVFLATFFMCIGALALMVYAKLSLAVMLFLGPIFIIMGIFSTSRGYFCKWIELLVNFALIPVLISAIIMLTQAITAATLPGFNGNNSGGFVATIPYLAISLVCAFLYKQVLGVAAALSNGIATKGFDFSGNVASSLMAQKISTYNTDKSVKQIAAALTKDKARK